MNFREVLISDKKIFDSFDYICSDYVFSYVYMYSSSYKLTIWDDDKTVVIRSGHRKPVFYMPLGDLEHGVKIILEYCSKKNIKPVFSKIPESHVDLFREFKFDLYEDRNSFDYIYRTSDLVKLEGKEYRKQRNNLFSYLRTYTPLFTTDIGDHIEECRKFTLDNFNRADIVNPTLRILEAFNNFDFQGGIVWNGSEMQAFCIYEKVDDSTSLAHVELTNNEHRGVHAYMITEISKVIDQEYINKEDDVGLAGLRRFKETFNPCHMLKKYTTCLELTKA